ncbi:MAG: DUF4974 domain-containing protein [Prevotellaceae bacterium]|nr:DUF4974 domain-containing protein [Prevotellaceae bacterium]
MRPNDNNLSDYALREALRNIQQSIDSTPLPDDFEERVMSRIREKEIHKPLKDSRVTGWRRRAVAFRRVAAALLIAAIVGGMAYAVVLMAGGLQMPSANIGNDSLSQVETPSIDGKEKVLFDNVRLDSIVSAVAAHYGRQVCFVDDELREVRLSTMWKEDTPLDAFIDILNEFEGFALTDERDTIFVTSTLTEEEGK